MEYQKTTNENVIAKLESELEDLRGKIKRLNDFIEKHYDGVDIDGDNYEMQHVALESQLSHMTGYALDLECRIELMRSVLGCE